MSRLLVFAAHLSADEVEYRYQTAKLAVERTWAQCGHTPVLGVSLTHDHLAVIPLIAARWPALLADARPRLPLAR